MIEHLDLQQFTCLLDLSGQFHIGLAGGKVSRWMIVGENEPAGEL